MSSSCLGTQDVTFPPMPWATVINDSQISLPPNPHVAPDSETALQEITTSELHVGMGKLPSSNEENSLPGGSVVKNLPAKQEMQVQSLGWEDALEKEMATHSSILAWRIPWTEECGGLESMGSQRVRHD